MGPSVGAGGSDISAAGMAGGVGKAAGAGGADGCSTPGLASADADLPALPGLRPFPETLRRRPPGGWLLLLLPFPCTFKAGLLGLAAPDSSSGVVWLAGVSENALGFDLPFWGCPEPFTVLAASGLTGSARVGGNLTGISSMIGGVGSSWNFSRISRMAGIRACNILPVHSMSSMDSEVKSE